jgi:hypothetical protein
MNSTPNGNSFNPLQDLFGSVAGDPGSERGLTHVTGLSNLRSLFLDAGSFEWASCRLPQLKKLTLGRGCRFEDFSQCPGSCNIELLEMKCITTFLIQGSTPVLLPQDVSRKMFGIERTAARLFKHRLRPRRTPRTRDVSHLAPEHDRVLRCAR